VEYLGRYAHGVAISNNRIIDFQNGYVVFKGKMSLPNMCRLTPLSLLNIIFFSLSEP
jgi:hypothetical protein